MAEGGRLNATTWFDRTNYFETVPKGAFELALWMEADRHGHLLDAVTQENLDNQRDVVKEEKRQRYDNVPYGNALIEVYAAVFPAGHPYHHPTIGSMEDLDAASLEDVHAFFRRYYGPNNTRAHARRRPHGRGGVRRRGAVLRPPAGLAPSRPGLAVAQLRAAEPSRCASTGPATCPNDRLHLAFRLPVDNTAGVLRRSPRASTSSAAWRPHGWYQRLVRREQIANGVQAHAMGFVDGVSLGFIVHRRGRGRDPDEVEAARGRGARRFAAGGPDRRRAGVRAGPVRARRGSPPSPARRSAPTSSATTRCSTATPASSTPSSTGWRR